MNCEVDEHGLVETDELTNAHFRRIDTPITSTNTVNVDGSRELPPPGIIWPKQKCKDNNEPTIERSTANKVGSQECVGRKTNGEWAKYRIAHKNKKNSGNSPLIPHSHKLAAPRTTSKEVSWAEVVATSE